jgi:hypothetical protein
MSVRAFRDPLFTPGKTTPGLVPLWGTRRCRKRYNINRDEVVCPRQCPDPVAGAWFASLAELVQFGLLVGRERHVRIAVPVENQMRTYSWCNPPRTARQRIRPALFTVRDRGASLSKAKCVRVLLYNDV